MFTLIRPRTAFITSGGVVAFDRLQREIQESPAIPTVYWTGSPDTNDLANVLLIFAAAPGPAEILAIDAIIAAHSGLNLPAGHGWSTNHTILALALAGTIAVSFVDDTFTLLAGATLKQSRVAKGPGLFEGAVVVTDINANVTVQLIKNGGLVGVGTTIAVVAGVPAPFNVPIAEAEYAAGNGLGVALTGLANGSNTCVEAFWQEGF